MSMEIRPQRELGLLPRSSSLILAALNLGLAFIAVYVSWAPIHQAYSGLHNKQCPDVIVVGAGIAGLEAARILQESHHSVLIFEKNGRIGGRGFVGGIGDKNTPIDYGGAWIHGVRYNPLTSLVDSMGFTRDRTTFDCIYFKNRHRANKKERELFREAVDKYEDKLEAAAKTIEGAPDNLSATKDVAETYAPASEFDDDIIALLTANSGPLESAVELSKTSAVDAAKFEAGDKFGGDDLVTKGMGAFVQKLGEGVPVLLNSPVTAIEYSGHGVKVTAAGITFDSSYALVTVSVGVLKKKDGIAFKPELPREKRNAIDCLPMGNMQKVIVPFKRDLFKKEAANSWILYEGDLPQGALPFATEHHLPLIHEKRAVMAFLIKPLNQNIAIGFFGGDWAKALEEQCTGHIEQFSGEKKECDKLSVAITKSALSKMSATTDKVIDESIQGEIHVTHWSLDPTSFGAYSAATPGEWRQRKILAKPVKDGTGTDRLFFAGEGTAEPKHNGSFAGAYESGERAAKEIEAAMSPDSLRQRLASVLFQECHPVHRVLWIFVGVTAYLAIAITIISLGIASYRPRRARLASQMLRLATVIAIVGAAVSSILSGNNCELAVTVILFGPAVYCLQHGEDLPTGDNPSPNGQGSS